MISDRQPQQKAEDSYDYEARDHHCDGRLPGYRRYIPEPRDRSALQGIRVKVMALLKAKPTLDARLV